MPEVECTCQMPEITKTERIMAEKSGLTPEFCHAMGDLFMDCFAEPESPFVRRESSGSTV